MGESSVKSAGRLHARIRWFLILFALPFAGAGLVVLLLAGRDVYDWQRMQAWQQVPAHILSADLKVSYGRKTHGRKSKSPSYMAQASYRYQYQGQDYTGMRVAISRGSDNIGSYQQDRYAELRSYRQSGTEFRCFVNPQQPEQAILYRDLRWDMLSFKALFSLIFGGVGFGLIALSPMLFAPILKRMSSAPDIRTLLGSGKKSGPITAFRHNQKAA